MTSVPPSNPALPQLLAAAKQQAPTVTIAAPPAALTALTAGSTIQATVAPSQDPRVTVLATADGNLSARTPQPLPQGADLTLEVVRATPSQLTVRLIAVDGQPLQQTPQGAPQAATPTVPTPPPTTTLLPTAPGAPPPLSPGFAWWPGGAQQITALPPISGFVIAGPQAPTTENAVPPGTLTTPNTAPAIASPVAPLVLSNGAEVTLRIAAISLPTPGTVVPTATPTPVVTTTSVESPVAATPSALLPAPSGTQTPDAQPTSATPVSATPAVAQTVVGGVIPDAVNTTGAASALPSSLAPNVNAAAATTVDDLAATVDDVDAADPDTAPGLVLPPASDWTSPAPAPPNGVQPPTSLAVLSGPIVTLVDGVPVVRLGDADVQLNVRANLPPGTMVTLDVHSVQTPVIAAAPPTPPPALTPLTLAQPGWPALSEALETLQRSDPATAQLLANAIPDGGPRTALAMMSFVQAMRTGEPRQWPGDTTLRALERLGPRGAHLADQLSAEVSDLSSRVRDAGTDWRAVPMPWNSEGRIERVRVVIRETDPDEEATKKKGGGGGTRFLVDLDLSRLGPLQIDGMFRKDSRHLDVMIRTKAALTSAIQQDLAGIFANSNAAMNLVGNLSFQIVRKFPDPLALPQTRDKSGLWV